MLRSVAVCSTHSTAAIISFESSFGTPAEFVRGRTAALALLLEKVWPCGDGGLQKLASWSFDSDVPCGCWAPWLRRWPRSFSSVVGLPPGTVSLRVYHTADDRPFFPRRVVWARTQQP